MAGNNRGASPHGENSESFEQSFQRLQEVVRKLSEGNLTLQQALAAFEEGMALADSCARMLDEAELRVKQVSERAMRAGVASLAELDEAMRGSPVRDQDEELITFEVETFESTLVFDVEDSPKPQADDRRRTMDDSPRGSSERAQSKVQNPKSKIEDLDPLFDEDD